MEVMNDASYMLLYQVIMLKWKMFINEIQKLFGLIVFQ